VDPGFWVCTRAAMSACKQRMDERGMPEGMILAVVVLA
jgi:hypothetical protein